MRPRRQLAGRACACALMLLGVTWAVAGCDEPLGPLGLALPVGRWTGGGACLSVAENGCNLIVGCGHGQFPRPVVHADGTFEIDGTYRIEAGPVRIDPAPPAHFSGFVNGSTLVLKVVPTAEGLLPATYTLKLGASGSCTVPCL